MQLLEETICQKLIDLLIDVFTSFLFYLSLPGNINGQNQKTISLQIENVLRNLILHLTDSQRHTALRKLPLPKRPLSKPGPVLPIWLSGSSDFLDQNFDRGSTRAFPVDRPTDKSKQINVWASRKFQAKQRPKRFWVAKFSSRSRVSSTKMYFFLDPWFYHALMRLGIYFFVCQLKSFCKCPRVHRHKSA